MIFHKHKVIALVGVLSMVATSAWAAAAETTASRVFAADSPSIVVVKAIDANDHALALGSGVVIAKGVVVSNCHVFTENGTESASVLYRNKRFPAKLRYADPDHDLCSLTVPGLGAPPVKMRGTNALEVGEDAYAIGAPEGFVLTLSSGIISSLRQVPGGTIIQMTSPISPGSSGGGLFDSEGRLIGITSYYAANGQQLNFALPTEWIEALPQRSKPPEELAQKQSKSSADVQQGVRAALSGDYATAVAILGPLAEQGNARAQFEIGFMYSNAQGVPQDYAKALHWYHLAAAQGFAEAQYNIGVMYDQGKGVPQDEAEAIEWYSKPAARGLAQAQYNIGLAYLQGRPGIMSDYAKAFNWLSKSAAEGYADAQLALGTMYGGGLGVPQNDAHAVEWFRTAAAQGVAGAQALLGVSYEYGRGVPQSYLKALDWYNKAAAQGNDIAETNLGNLYGAGHGVPQDDTKAAYWYGKAAEQGVVVAQANLGARYAAGRGVPQDFMLSTKWLILAHAGGDEEAGKLVIKLEQIMPAAQVAKAQRLAQEWWSDHHK
ncbi:MAG: trypsin-like peptidase domain-containing protein [Vulcanimicrobiaceae bacterium]